MLQPNPIVMCTRASSIGQLASGAGETRRGFNWRRELMSHRQSSPANTLTEPVLCDQMACCHRYRVSAGGHSEAFPPRSGLAGLGG
jgi:hypothetical protein